MPRGNVPEGADPRRGPRWTTGAVAQARSKARVCGPCRTRERDARWARAWLSGSVCSAPPCARGSPSPRQAGPNPPGTPGLLGRDAGNVLITSLSVLSGLTGASLGGQQGLGLGRGNERRALPRVAPAPRPLPGLLCKRGQRLREKGAPGVGTRSSPAGGRAWAGRGAQGHRSSRRPQRRRDSEHRDLEVRARCPGVGASVFFTAAWYSSVCIRPILLVCPSVAGPCAAHTCWQCRRGQDCVSP